MAGRDISVTHVALGATRLMRTHGMMGEVVGMAASVCKKHSCDPRGVYERHFDKLKELMTKGVGDGKRYPRQTYNLQRSLDRKLKQKYEESVEGRITETKSKESKKSGNASNINGSSVLRLEKVPLEAEFSEDGYYVWGASLVKDDAGMYHLFYPHWKKEHGFGAWVTCSEIARATSKDLFGRFTPQGVVLPERGVQFWDGHCTYNPTIRKWDGKYYLYYTGNFGDRKRTKGLNWSHRNNQRIGVAVADRPEGPWRRFDKPVLDISPDNNAYDALMISNPSVERSPNGSFLMVYKGVGKKRRMPFGGPVVHLAASSTLPTGPFTKNCSPIFTNGKSLFAAEDPYISFFDGCYHALIKDMGGNFVKGTGRTIVHFKSIDGCDWRLADIPLVTGTTLYWADGKVQKLRNLERPQLYFENGRPVALLAAAKPSYGHSFNVRIPVVYQIPRD